MLIKEFFSICTFYAVSPVHAGSGAATAAVDLPIQRERHTNWPHIQASGVKGAMRDHYRRVVREEDRYLTNLIFGIDRDNDGDVKDKNNRFFDKNRNIIADKEKADDRLTTLAGAVSFSDARLVAFPMRSNVAPFVWVTSPLVLERLNTDLDYTKFKTLGDIPRVEGDTALVMTGKYPENVILEDAVVAVDQDTPAPALPEGFPGLKRLLLISEEMFDYCVSSCTEIQTQIKIDSDKGTAAEGALRYQELLPADTLLYAVIYYSRSPLLDELKADVIRGHVEDTIKDFIQIGGDETLGRGICRIAWLSNDNGLGGAA